MTANNQFGLVPCQVTDDGELAISLAKGLVGGQGVLRLSEILAQYQLWFRSDPFDVGQATRNAFSALDGKINQDSYNAICKAAKSKNHGSQSNGCLMRILPLCIWGLRMKEEDLKRAIRLETQITHSNETAIQACIVYAIAVIEVIKTSDGSSALNRAKCYIQANSKECAELGVWWKDCVEERSSLIESSPHIGWLKIA